MNLRAPRNIRFECQRCARCCGDTPHRGRIIYMLEDEVHTISEYIGLNQMEFSSPISGYTPYKYKVKKRNGVCVFLKDGACRIYPVRPSICRTYPFNVVKRNNTLMFEVSDDCPGIGLGDRLEDNEFKKIADYVKSVFDKS